MTSLTKRFQNALDDLRKEDQFPGATAAFVLPDGTIVGVATGLSDNEKGIAMSKDAQQPIGTLEESFLALVALSLEQEGIINLDEPIYRYFDTKGGDAWILNLPNAKTITLRHLLTHSSGLVDEPSKNDIVSSAGKNARTTITSEWASGEIEFAVDGEPGFIPGNGFAVTDTDYRFAAMVLEQVSTEKYHALLEERIINTFAFKRTETLHHSKLENVSPGYIDSDEEHKINSQEMLNQEDAFGQNNGGLLSNPQELVRWARLLYEEDALEKPYMEELFASGYRGSDRSSEFGLGVYIHDTTAGEAYGHSGKVAGYETNLIYFPKYKVGICVQVNRSYGNDLRKYVETLAQVVLNGLPE